MANLLNPIGKGKAYAALAAGVITTGIVAFANQYLPHEMPQATVNGLQTLITVLAVYYTPHGGPGSSGG